MNDDDILCTIKWTVADVRTAFKNKYGREPSKGELQDCVDNLDTSALEEVSIERGWSVVDEAII